jgi:hypothetical protein
VLSRATHLPVSPCSSFQAHHHEPLTAASPPRWFPLSVKVPSEAPTPNLRRVPFCPITSLTLVAGTESLAYPSGWRPGARTCLQEYMHIAPDDAGIGAGSSFVVDCSTVSIKQKFLQIDPVPLAFGTPHRTCLLGH